VSAAQEPTRSVEIERTYDVDGETPLPDWSGLPGISSIDGPQQRELDARYFDTPRLDLARAKVAIRRRTGGHDAGWHVKSSAPEGRHEWGWPIVDDELTVPDAVAAAVANWASAPFVQIARIRNHRTAYLLRDPRGGVVAEVVDDRVRASEAATGAERTWREWEVELGPAAPADAAWRELFFAAVDALVTAAGGAVSASDSKLGRALGR
jgi:inorganic triphosphatase YgiF